MTPIQRNGKWFVDGEINAGPFDTNAQAWRWIDRATNEPHNRKEAAHDWAASQFLKSDIGHFN